MAVCAAEQQWQAALKDAGPYQQKWLKGVRVAEKPRHAQQQTRFWLAVAQSEADILSAGEERSSSPGSERRWRCGC